MHKDSIFIIATPNPFNVEQFLSIFFNNAVAVNPEHTAWLDPRVMFETIHRAGMKIVDFYWSRARFGCHVRKFFWIATVLSFILRKQRFLFERDYMVIVKLN